MEMKAVKAQFDGLRIVLPQEMDGGSPGEVIVIFADASNGAAENDWLKGQEQVLSEIWDNPQDAEYDQV